MDPHASSKPPFPWQLWIFSVLHLLGFFALFIDLCSLVTGSGTDCTTAEHITSNMFSLTFLWVGVFYGIFTYRSRNDSGKLKRLAMLATDCSAALFAGVVLTGNTKFGGFERNAFHICDMLFFFALFLIMQSETHSDTPAAKSTPLKNGMGWNCKALILLFLILVTLKIFLMSDMMSVDFLFATGDDQVTSSLARFFWDFTIVFLFEFLLATAFVLYYGDFDDHEAYIIAVAVMQVVSFLYTIPIWGSIRADLMPKGIIGSIVVIVVCILAVFVGRKQRQRSGYNQVSTNV